MCLGLWWIMVTRKFLNTKLCSKFLEEMQPIKLVLRMLYHKPILRETRDRKEMGYHFFFLLLKMGQSGIKSKAKFLSQCSPAHTRRDTHMQTNTLTMTVLLLTVVHKKRKREIDYDVVQFRSPLCLVLPLHIS